MALRATADRLPPPVGLLSLGTWPGHPSGVRVAPRSACAAQNGWVTIEAFSAEEVGGAGTSLVAVAVDAAGARGQPAVLLRRAGRLRDIEAGEAVLVEFGRRQALGIVLGPATRRRGSRPSRSLERVRTDGPLLPPLGMRLAAWIAERYLAPPALTLRAMLPPGLLERLELVAERTPDARQDHRRSRAPGQDRGRPLARAR